MWAKAAASFVLALIVVVLLGLFGSMVARAQGIPGLMLPPGILGSGPPQLVGTFNPSDKGAAVTLSNGNLTLTAPSFAVARSTTSMMVSAYYEVVIGSPANVTMGVSNSSSSNTIAYAGQDDNSVGLDNTGVVYFNSGNAVDTGLGTLATGSVIGVKAFADGSVAFNKNGGAFSSAYSSTGLTGGPLFIMCGATSAGGGGALTLNATPTYPVPAGFTFWGN